MNAIVSKIAQIFTDLLFPSICQGCGEAGSYLCKKCANEKIKYVEEQVCHVCKRELKNQRSKIKNIDKNSEIEFEKNLVHIGCKKKTALDGVFVVAHYSKFIENYIGDIKYEFYFAMIPDLVRLMNSYLGQDELFRQIVRESVITFVPLNSWRQRWRGFNQSENIAKLIAKHWHRECINLMNRKKKTECQVGLKRAERLINLKGAFNLHEGDLRPPTKLKAINHKLSAVIVDDVMTSGATLEECAKVLRANGFGKIYGLVFTRG